MLHIIHVEITGIKWIWEKIKLLSNGEWIEVEIRIVTLVIFCGGSYQPIMDKNRGVKKWGINCNYTDIYTWVSLTTTSQVASAYIS